MQQGKKIRMSRLFNTQTDKTIIVPMDHALTDGPIQGLVSPQDICQELLAGGADAVLGHTGMLRHGYASVPGAPAMGNILQLAGISSVTPSLHRKQPVHTVEDALRIGADAVSYHFNLGNEYEYEMLRDFGTICNEADRRGIPVLAMVYARGPQVEEKAVRGVAHAARFAAEVGADIVKVAYTGNVESMKIVVQGCPIPVVISGGSSLSDKDTLLMIQGAMQAGCKGLSMGRNIFGRENPSAFLQQVRAIVHENKKVDEVLS